VSSLLLIKLGFNKLKHDNVDEEADDDKGEEVPG
jgi:hypothetical protein